MVNLAGEYPRFLRRLRFTSNLLVLTINGKIAPPVQDVDPYRKLYDQVSVCSVKPAKEDKI